MSKPGKVLKAMCKKLGVRLTVKRGQKRVYKSIKVLKEQCKRKKVKRKRRRKFGSLKSLQMMSAEVVVDDLFRQLNDENLETFDESFYDLYFMMKKTGYPDITLNILVKKYVAKREKIIEREKKKIEEEEKKRKAEEEKAAEEKAAAAAAVKKEFEDKIKKEIEKINSRKAAKRNRSRINNKKNKIFIAMGLLGSAGLGTYLYKKRKNKDKKVKSKRKK